MNLSRLSRQARTEAAALTVAAIGIIIQIIGGVKYPVVPPGLIILLAGAALVAFLPWRRIGALLGVLVGAFMIFGAAAASTGRYDLTHPGHPGAFIGTWIQLIAVVVAVIAGLAALAVRNRSRHTPSQPRHTGRRLSDSPTRAR
jgi:membrane-bound ClpP family serine protease